MLGNLSLTMSTQLTKELFMTMVGLCLAFIVAEITPLFLVTCFTIIAADLHALDQIVWILVAPYIATGAIAPFVGTLSDLMGRRGIILTSLVVVLVSFILQGAAPVFAVFLIGGILCGASIGVLILSVIAAASELVPMHKRGATIGYLSLGVIPFAPGSLYGQLIAETSWRYIYLMLGLIAALALVVLTIYYKPPPRPTTLGLSKMDQLKRIDYVGSFLSTSGVVIFLVGINWGGQDYAWNSTHVITCLVTGIAIMGLFAVWEIYLVKYPLFPARLIQSKRHFFAVSVLCLTSGVSKLPLTPLSHHSLEK
jgi:MFS family permease